MVHGFHATIYPVDLPQWLDEVHKKEMIGRFRDHLCRELAEFVNPKQDHITHRHARQESNGSNSTCSSAGEGTAVFVNAEAFKYI